MYGDIAVIARSGAARAPRRGRRRRAGRARPGLPDRAHRGAGHPRRRRRAARSAPRSTSASAAAPTGRHPAAARRTCASSASPSSPCRWSGAAPEVGRAPRCPTARSSGAGRSSTTRRSFPRFEAVPEEAGAHVVLLGARPAADGGQRPAHRRARTASAATRSARSTSSEFEKLEGCVTCLSVRVRRMSARHVLDDVAWHALTGPHADLAVDLRGRPRQPVRATRSRRSAASQHLDDRRLGGARRARRPRRRGGVPARRGRGDPGRLDRAAPRARATQYVAGDLAAPPAGASREVTELTASDVARHGAAGGGDRTRAVRAEQPPHRALVRHPPRGSAGRDGGGADAGRGVRRGQRGLRRPFGAWRGARCGGDAGGGARHPGAGRPAMLHVRDGNDGAHRLYRRVGFEARRPVTVALCAGTVVSSRPASWPDGALGVGAVAYAWDAGSVLTGHLLLRCRGGA